ncbi:MULTISPECIES: chitin disaccharide deacetylase [Clostridium]|uniref:chitin disaccharide deacetylase n=1 Tax=Clostridium TaxID=1485 RepID=UPI00062E7EBD|nr:chitin disaccharide deacetylase [Clostridium sp. C8]KLE17224.1 hypothetical protein AAT22_02540 [Clostridium sp. C8]
MKRVIINADDFGYSSAVNQGIIKSHKDGILTSTTLMANMPGCDEAILLAKENVNLGVGAHLVLTCGKPLTKVTSLIDEKGDFYNLVEYKKHRKQMCDEEIFQEWSYQIDYLIDQGLNLTHLDSHHHVHSFPENLEITKRIANKYNLCFRNIFNLEENIELPAQKGIKGFFDLMNHTAIRDLTIPFYKNPVKCFEEIQIVLDKVKDNEITELMVHPAYVDEILYFNSSFNIQRMKEVSILCDSQMKKLLEKNKIVTCSYKNL